jgi:hypothetical protein
MGNNIFPFPKQLISDASLIGDIWKEMSVIPTRHLLMQLSEVAEAMSAVGLSLRFFSLDGQL